MVLARGCTSWREGIHTFGGRGLGLLLGGLDVFPPVELGINRPNSGADHRYGGSQTNQHDGDKRIPQSCQQDPELDNCDDATDQWRPQAKKQKHAGDSRGKVWKARL